LVPANGDDGNGGAGRFSPTVFSVPKTSLSPMI
jgi:hypothetical protein